MRISADHPALAGHFPGQPVVPGVVLLDQVIQALEAHLGRVPRVTGLPSVKFLAPLEPEADFHIEFADKGAGRAAFTVLGGDRKLATGSLQYEA